MRPDLRWHDGTPFTADDVVFTFGILHDKDFPGDSALAAAWRDVQVDAPTDHTVRLTLPAPDSSFQEFVNATGFDPRRDIHEILMASPGDPAKKSGLLAAKRAAFSKSLFAGTADMQIPCA